MKSTDMKTMFISYILLITSIVTYAQTNSTETGMILNGYMNKIGGQEFNYTSPVPDVGECLIVRANDGNSSMEWETSPLPDGLEGEFVTYSWIASIGSSPGYARFDVEINGTRKFSFSANGESQWDERSEGGYRLSFENIKVDRYGDHFGYMYLRIPISEYQVGKSLKIKITGGKYNKSTWCMTYKFPLTNSLKFKSLPAIFKEDGKEKQLSIASMFYFGNSPTTQVYIDNRLYKEVPIKFGYNSIRIGLPIVKKDKIHRCKVIAGDFIYIGTISASPVRKWEVNFVQHSHTDIGYTRSQTEILGEHLRFIDYALDYCDITDDYPEEAKFKWTCEATWPVNEYIRSRPAAQVDRLKKRVSEGRIEIAGMYFNFDELPDEQILAASLQPIKKIRDAGLEVKVAMQNDVNGIGWCLIDYYSQIGIKYLNMGTHGHRALICFDKPTLFWWESPSGNKMLAYRAEHYMTGNFFEIHREDFSVFENRLLSYLVDLKDKGYEYNLLSIQFSGYFTDNSSPSTPASDMIKQWNEKYDWPKLKTATATDFFEEMEARHGNEFQTIRGAWPDWWTDGFGASAREVATTRQAQTDLIANMSGLTMAAILGSDMPEQIEDRIYWANDALLFYTEHTVGYHNSVREPFHKYSMEQRALKESYAWEAGRRARMIGEETLGLLQSHAEREKQPSLVVFNTLNWDRSGLVTTYIDHELVPNDREFHIVDEDGEEIQAQVVEPHGSGSYWAIWVNDIPAFGFKKYVISVTENKKEANRGNEKVYELENQWYKIKIDNQRGAIESIYDKDIDKELVDQNAEWKLGEFIYETLGNRGQMERFYLDDYKREPLDEVWFERYEEGDIWNAVHLQGNTKAAIGEGDFELEIRLFNTSKRLDLVYSILKKSVTEPEGIYISFPFTLDDGILSFDVQGGEIRAGIDQIPGSTNDWNVVQNYARLWNDSEQILLSSQEIPMMQFGGINTGRYEAGAIPESTHIYGWPMNNYWTTNFNAEQHGGINWIYNISSSTDHTQQEATRFGWGNRVPLLARVLPGGGNGGINWEKSIIQGWPENVILVSSIPDESGNSSILHIREINGEEADLKSLKLVNGKHFTIKQVNVLGEVITPETVELKPYEAKFIKISW
ncbi:glycoside hydrolase family 38 C-terminal domain-containing protein [Bacteroidota bacterium]